MIGPVRRRPPVPEEIDDIGDVTPEEDGAADLYAGLGTSGVMSLFKPREQILREWSILADPVLIDRAWGAQPVPDATSSIAREYLNAACDPHLTIQDVLDLAEQDRLRAYCGVDTAGSRKRTADRTALATIYANPKTRHVYLADLKYEHGASLPRQVQLVREIDRTFAPRFRIEGNGPALASAEHLASQVHDGAAFSSTVRNKWSQQIGVPALVHAFASRLVTIPWNTTGRVRFGPLVHELQSFPHGRHDDAVDALRFALAAFVLDTARSPTRVQIGAVTIPRSGPRW